MFVELRRPAHSNALGKVLVRALEALPDEVRTRVRAWLWSRRTRSSRLRTHARGAAGGVEGRPASSEGGPRR